MQYGRLAVLGCGVLVAVVAPARADEADAKAARALVDKALKAHGGAEAVGKFHGTVAKFKGTFHGMGAAIPMSGEISTQGGNKLRVDVEVEAGGQTIRIVNVMDGGKGWTRVGDATKEMSKDEAAEAAEQAHAGWVASLVPLAGKGYTLATAGELLVADKPALGVKVSSKGHRDVTLYFDKTTSLLVKHESKVKDEGTGQEVTEEAFLKDYKDVQGVQHAAKFVSHRDGKLYMEGDVTDLQLAEKIGADVFAKP